MRKPNLKSQAYISVSCEKGFDVSDFQWVRTFSMTIQPVIENKKNIEIKLNDSYCVQFNYNDKKGLSIEKICKELEGMAVLIREHYRPFKLK